MWRDFPHGGQVRGSYGWAVQFSHPSLILEDPSTYQPASNLFWASEPLLVLRASEVQIRYFLWWKLMPPFQVPSTTFLQPSWSFFQHIPSQQSCNIYIYIHNIIYIHRPFPQGPSTSHIHISEFATVLANPVIFTNWGK